MVLNNLIPGTESRSNFFINNLEIGIIILYKRGFPVYFFGFLQIKY